MVHTRENRLRSFLSQPEVIAALLDTPPTGDPLPAMVEALALRSGLTTERLQALVDEVTCLPTPGELERICIGTMTPTDRFIALAPSMREPTPLRDVMGKDVLRVTVVGLGNFAHVFCGLMGDRDDVEVRALGVRPGRAETFADKTAAGGPTVTRSPSMGGGTVRGRVAKVGDDPADVIPGADLILMSTPSHVEAALLQQIAPFVDDEAIVCAIPGPGGFHWAAQAAFADKPAVTIAGLMTIPWMSKADVFGERARALGQKAINGVACVQRERTERVADILTALFRTPTVDVESFLQLILNPSNQLLHPIILWDQVTDDDGGPITAPWTEPPLFYETLSARAAALLDEASDELQAIKYALLERDPERTLSAVLPIDIAIRAAYADDIVDASDTRHIISTNRAYAGIRTPCVAVEGGVRADFGSRFLTEDIPYGLVVVRGLADVLGVKTPVIDRFLRWGQDLLGQSFLVGDRLEGKDLAQSGLHRRYGITDDVALR